MFIVYLICFLFRVVAASMVLGNPGKEVVKSSVIVNWGRNGMTRDMDGWCDPKRHENPNGAPCRKCEDSYKNKAPSECTTSSPTPTPTPPAPSKDPPTDPTTATGSSPGQDEGPPAPTPSSSVGQGTGSSPATSSPSSDQSAASSSANQDSSSGEITKSLSATQISSSGQSINSLPPIPTVSSSQSTESLPTTPSANSSPNADSLSASSKPSPKTKAIIGGVIGGFFFLLLVGLLIFGLIRRRRRNHAARRFTFNRELMVQPRGAPKATFQAMDYDLEAAAIMAQRASMDPFDRPGSSASQGPTQTSRQLDIQLRITKLQAQILELQHQVNRTHDVERMRRQVEWLLEQEESPWALGLTDERPPNYDLYMMP